MIFLRTSLELGINLLSWHRYHALTHAVRQEAGKELTIKGMVAAAVAGSALTLGASMAAAPAATADYLVEGQPSPPPGEGMGHTSISTEPGGIVHVNIIGRFDALHTVGPYANGCRVMLGNNGRGAGVKEQFVTLDSTGSGTATFGPGETSAAYDGWCGSQSHDNRPADLFVAHPRDCVDHACRTTGTLVEIDGGPPVVAPNYPRPDDPDKQAPPVGCADQLSHGLDKLPPGTELALEKLKQIGIFQGG